MTSPGRRLASVAAAVLSLAGLPYLAYLALYALLRPSGAPVEKRPPAPGEEPSVSVVLPTYNEARIVRSKLEDLVAIDYPPERIELVVVDSSDDRTPEIVREFFADREAPTLTLLEEEERRGLAPALNDAYAAASNDVVVKTDCDSRIAADSIREAVATLADPEVGAVTGRNVEVLGGSAVEAGYRDVQAHVQTLESQLDSTFIFHGPFSAFERESIVPIDPESLADDTELALLIRRNGERVVFDPAVRYMEAAHSDFRKRRTQKDRRAMGLLRLLFQHRDALGRYGNYGRIVLPFNWWFMVASPWLVAVGLVVASVAAIVIAGPFGIALPAALAAFVVLGSRDRLGALQPAYALFDTQVSLFVAAVRLLRGEGDGTWDVDAELRRAFE